MIFVINVVYWWNLHFLYNAHSSWLSHVLLRWFKLITLVLIIVSSRPFEFYLRSTVVWRWILHLWAGFNFINREIILITGWSVKGNLSSLISHLRNWLALDFRRFNILRFIWSYSFKLDCGSNKLCTWRWILSEYILIFRILYRLYRIGLILIFVGTLANERYLI